MGTGRVPPMMPAVTSPMKMDSAVKKTKSTLWRTYSPPRLLHQ